MTDTLIKDRFGFPHPADAHLYVPLDARERAENYQRFAGDAESWPIPLTRCGEPTPARWGAPR